MKRIHVLPTVVKISHNVQMTHAPGKTANALREIMKAAAANNQTVPISPRLRSSAAIAGVRVPMESVKE